MAIGRQNQRTQMMGYPIEANRPITDLTDRAGMGSSLLGTLARAAELGGRECQADEKKAARLRRRPSIIVVTVSPRRLHQGKDHLIMAKRDV
jgi:hypothetical protein